LGTVDFIDLSCRSRGSKFAQNLYLPRDIFPERFQAPGLHIAEHGRWLLRHEFVPIRTQYVEQLIQQAPKITEVGVQLTGAKLELRAHQFT
jgi:hypothetical protein